MDSKLDMQEKESRNFTVNAIDVEDEQRIKFQEWGFQMDRLFEVAYRFYKRNEGKAFNPSFDVRNQMSALMMQARYGNLESAKLPDLGTLDLVGKRRRQEWSRLHGMSKLEAMSKFICSLDEMCSLFKAHAEAVKLSTNIQQDYSSAFDDLQPAISIPKGTDGEQLQAIYNSLCRQTNSQFKNYAERQFPDDVLKQKNLISNLQAQYYRQYISQMHPELSNKLQPSHSDSQSLSSNSDTTMSTSRASPVRSEKQSTCEDPSLIGNELAEISLNSEQTPSQDPSNQMKYYADGGMDKTEDSKTDTVTTEQLPVQSEPIKELPSSIDLNTASNDSQTMECINRAVEKLESNTEEPKRNYERVKPSNIGSFESFPEPKPITKSNFSQRTCPEDPHLVPSSTVAKPSEPTVEDILNRVDTRTKPFDDITPPHLDLPPVSKIMSNPSAVEPVQTEQQESLVHKVEHIQPPILPLVPNQEYAVELVKDEWPSNHECVPQSAGREPPELWGPPTTSHSASPIQDSSIVYNPLEAATLWTKRGIREFKDSLVDDQHAGEYMVKQGSRLIIQVPTYPDGSYIYWEFATDGYDIGFGVDFVRENELEEPLAMQIFEDSDDDEDDDDIFDEEEAYYATAQIHNNAHIDPELGLNQYNSTNPNVTRPIPNSSASNMTLDSKKAVYEKKRAEKLEKLSRTIPIVPIYRRDSHEDVIVGRHKYPGKGYYRLKFDNTYSVLRSKTLFFRVCFFT